MKSRPLAVSLIAWLFIISGTMGFLYHATEFKSAAAVSREWVAVLLIRLVAILGGVFLLRGRNWARWLVVAWMAYHVVLSAFHSYSEMLMHGLLLGAIAYFLFRRSSAAYFRPSQAESAPKAGGVPSSIANSN